MKHPVHRYKTRLLLAAGALFVLCTGSAAQAQTSNETGQLLNRIKQIENQIQTMSRAVYRGDPNAEAALANAASGVDTTAVANFEARMSQVEDQQRQVTGQLEKITFEIQQLKEKIERMQADNEQRFVQLEQGRAAAPAPSGTPVYSSGGPQAPSSGTLGSPGNGPAETLYDEAFSHVRDMKYDEAEVKFRQFLQDYPAHPLAANAQYWLGETYYVRGDYKLAAKSFAQGYQDFPKSAKAADSLFKLSLSLFKLDKKDDACLSLRQLQKEFQTAAGPLQRKAAQEISLRGCPK